MIGIGNRIPLTHDLFQQRTLGTVPKGDALAHAPVQSAKIVLHLAKVGEQFVRQRRELLKPVF